MPDASSMTRLGLPFFGVTRADTIALPRSSVVQPIATSRPAVLSAAEDHAARIRRRADAPKTGGIAKTSQP